MTTTSSDTARAGLEPRSAPRARVGVFGIGLEAYWAQFNGLRERISGYQRRVEERVSELGAEVVSAGLVDTPEGARDAGDRFAGAQVDLVLCHAVTYATSGQVLPAVQAAKVPVVLLGLQPTASLDYANTGTGEWLANCAACCVPELAGAFTRARIPYDTVAGTIEDEQLQWSARVAVGLDHLAADFELDGLTYYYRGLDGNEAERLGAGVIVGNSLLTARGVPTSGEGDLKTNLAQLILDRLGAGGSYTEYYALDFDEGFVLMGHDGPGHVAIAQERPVLRSLKLFHGKRGAGLSVEFKVRYGPITILGCTQDAEGRLRLLAAEGESIPGATFRIGNTNSRLRFGSPPAEFFERWCAHGPTHHVALGITHRVEELRRVAALLDLPFAVVG